MEGISGKEGVSPKPAKIAAKKKANRKWVKQVIPYALLVPAFIFTAGILIYPTLRMLQFSFLNWSFGKGFETARWAGLENYVWLFTSPTSTLFHALRLTLFYAAVSIVAELVIGLAVAVLIHREGIFGRTILLTGFMIPTLLMPVMVGMMWRMFMYPNGIVNYVLRSVGISINWYTAEWAMPAVILIEIWQYTPFFIISFVAGLRAIPNEVLDAAAVDGASGWNRFWNISLPYLKPLIVVTVMIRTLWLLKSFDIIYTMFTGGPGSATEVLGLSIYRALFSARSIGHSAALSIILGLLTLIITYLFVRFIYRSREAMEGVQ